MSWIDDWTTLPADVRAGLASHLERMADERAGQPAKQRACRLAAEALRDGPEALARRRAPPTGTQLERAVQLGERLRVNEKDLAALRDVLDQAQNDPPAGFADGSMSLNHWNALRHTCDALEAARAAHGNFVCHACFPAPLSAHDTSDSDDGYPSNGP